MKFKRIEGIPKIPKYRKFFEPQQHIPKMTQTILLFDMDGVILKSQGYYRGLQAAIMLLGKNLGIRRAEVSMDSISKLEAVGIYHIWDHMAIFSALLLSHIWKKIPDARIPYPLKPDRRKFLNIPAIDFTSFIQKINSNQTYELHQINQLLQGQNGDLQASQRAYLDLLFESSQEIYQSPVLPIMQEFVLGSQLFSKLYNLPNQLNVQSYPQRYDKATLTSENHKRLQVWLGGKHHHAAIFTNRPSSPPTEAFFGTPEAEIGAEIIGLQRLPLIGAGSLAWLAAKNGQPLQSYNKPHPVHALAAIQAAIGQPIVCALNLAVNLAGKNSQASNHKDWQVLSEAQVYAFEDSKGGLLSVQKAGQLLANAGIRVDIKLIGIGEQADKKKALFETADQVFDDINSSPLPAIISSESQNG